MNEAIKAVAGSVFGVLLSYKFYLSLLLETVEVVGSFLMLHVDHESISQPGRKKN